MVQDLKHVTDALKTRRAALLSVHKDIQPIIVTVGPTTTSIDQVYVAVAGSIYRLTSVMKAFDVCFQSYMALYLKYPLESERLWIFVQRVLYHIELDLDKNVPYQLINAYKNVPLNQLA